MEPGMTYIDHDNIEKHGIDHSSNPSRNDLTKACTELMSFVQNDKKKCKYVCAAVTQWNSYLRRGSGVDINFTTINFIPWGIVGIDISHNSDMPIPETYNIAKPYILISRGDDKNCTTSQVLKQVTSAKRIIIKNHELNIISKRNSRQHMI